jgi:alkylhydroperoxidase/carboxymuconolactone decarboxylase family protein
MNLNTTAALLADHEVAVVRDFGRSDGRFADALRLAETLHLHIKVDDTHQLPINEFFRAGAQLDHQKNGFVKYRFPGDINAIFSHIKVSQDELLETEENRRPRPFLDHIGIDLRQETPETRAVFDALPAMAAADNLPLASQGGPGRPVYCCHVEVSEKHWIYPSGVEGKPGIPLEFAYGPLKVNPDKSGCDLRPANPSQVDPASIPCCASSGGEVTRGKATEGAPRGYYQPSDLARFGDVGRSNPAVSKLFFDYYAQAMADGKLSRREKTLIGLAVAHALRCPYCIDSLSGSCLDLGISEAEMMEAVHVSAALAAGVTLVHATQTLGHVDARGAAANGNGHANGH